MEKTVIDEAKCEEWRRNGAEWKRMGKLERKK